MGRRQQDQSKQIHYEDARDSSPQPWLRWENASETNAGKFITEISATRDSALEAFVASDRKLTAAWNGVYESEYIGNTLRKVFASK